MKLLIVDDEITTIMRIRRQIPWNNLPIDEIQTAEDGIDALNKCKTFSPDILLSDIRMPRMNGVCLAQTLRKSFPLLQIIFLSGYTDKEYFKSAIRLNVISYVEKPIDMKECFHALKQACELTKLENVRNTELQELSDQATQQRLEQIAIMLSSAAFDKDQVASLIQACHANILSVSFCVALKIDFHSSDQKSTESLLQYKQAINHMVMSMGETICTAVKHDYIVAFLFYNCGNDRTFLQRFCEQLYIVLTEKSLLFSIAVGRVTTEWSSLPKSYQDAVIASLAVFYHENGYISYYYDMRKSYSFDKISGNSFIEGIKTMGKEQFLFHIQSLFSEIRTSEATLPVVVKHFMQDMATELYKLGNTEGVSIWPNYNSIHDISDFISACEYMKDIELFLINGVYAYYKGLDSGKTGNTTIDNIVRIVRKKYSDPELSISEISSMVGLSETYVSHLFKELTGENLKTYISEYRLLQAKELLRTTGIPVKDIAEAVGFRNGNYFASKFRQQYHCTPTQYKENEKNH